MEVKIKNTEYRIGTYKSAHTFIYNSYCVYPERVDVVYNKKQTWDATFRIRARRQELNKEKSNS